MFSPAGYKSRHGAHLCEPVGVKPTGLGSSAAVGPRRYVLRRRSRGHRLPEAPAEGCRDGAGFHNRAARLAACRRRRNVIARFVVNLLENVLLRAVGHEIAVAALSFAEEPDESVLRFVYGQSVWNIHLVWCCMLSYGSFRV